MKNSINILFAGDFAPCRRFEKIVLEKEEQVFGDLLPLIKNADISFVNLECSLTLCNKPIEKSGPPIKSDPKCIEALKSFSIIGLANNHVMDFDKKGLTDTLKACESINTPTVGAGTNLQEAQEFKIIEKDGFKLAIIALAEHEFNQADEHRAGSAPIDAIDNYHQIKQAKEQSDIVIVTLHAGNEYFPYPSPNARKLCKHYIDLGVEAVICHHPHVPGAYEYYNKKPIFYSIGNFLFDNEKPPQDWDEGYMVDMEVDKDNKDIKNITLIPYNQSIEIGGLKHMENKEKENFLKKIEDYRLLLENEKSYQREWKTFVEKQANSYILRQYVPNFFKGVGFLAKKISFVNLFLKSRNVLDKLNLIRCQSHHELLKASLESKMEK
jgi:poly-gamma-glutamate synthesis protein (capsule biosynthesis protein)